MDTLQDRKDKLLSTTGYVKCDKCEEPAVINPYDKNIAFCYYCQTDMPLRKKRWRPHFEECQIVIIDGYTDEVIKEIDTSVGVADAELTKVKLELNKLKYTAYIRYKD